MSELSAIPTQIRQQGVERFDVLAGLLPRGVRPSDIDQVLENDGAFLFIEFKRPDQTIPTGQRILMKRLATLPNCEVLLVRGHPPRQIESFGWFDAEQWAGDAMALRAFVLSWWNSKEKAA